MAIGKTPVNQLNALPLQDADANAAGGVIQVIGGVLVRFFDANALQINATAVSTINTRVCLVTPYLDLRGCRSYVMQLRTTNPGVRAALASMTLRWQYRMGPGDAPAVTYVQGGGINDQFNGIFASTGGVIFPATAGANEVQTQAWGWTNGSDVNTGVVGQVLTALSSDIRFIFDWQTNPVAAANLFTAYLWASS